MTIKLIMSMLSLVVFLSACDLTIDEIDQFILDNPEIIDRVDELTESARQRLENSGLNEESNIAAVEESAVDDESSEIIEESEMPLIEVNTDSGVVESSGLDEIDDDPIEELESSGIIEVETSGVVEESSSSGGGSSSTPVNDDPMDTEELAGFIESNVFKSFATSLNLPYSYDFLPGQSISGVVYLNEANADLISLKVRLAFNNNPDLWLTSETIDPTSLEIVVQSKIPASYGVDFYQRAELVWQTATSSGVYQPQWAGSNGNILELPMTSGLSLAPYTVLLRPDSVDSGLVEEPIFAYAYQILSGIYKIPHLSVIRPETVLEDNGRKWGLVMVGLGYPENGIWIETSYSGAYRGQYAGKNMYYSLEQDIFVSSLNQLDPNYSPPVYSSGVTESSGVASSGLIDSGLINTNPPVITLNCDSLCIDNNTIRINVNDAYVEQGATALDNEGTSIAISISGVIDTSKLGNYTINYSAVDTAGRSSEVNRTVIVADLLAPVITMIGDAILTIEINSVYTELGATAEDNYDSSVIVTMNGIVDTKKVGEYVVTYSSKDSSNNQSILTRRINIVDTVNPEITIRNIEAFSDNYPMFDLNRDLIPFINETEVRMDQHGNHLVIGSNNARNSNGTRTGAIAIIDLTDRNSVRVIYPPTNVEMSFGNSIAINDDYVVVSAYLDNRDGFRSGSVYVYKISDPNYLRIITPSDGRTELRWASSIAINEEYLLVGSRNDNTYFTQAGAVYAYRFDDYTYVHKFYASVPSLSAMFGGGIDINNNNIASIGAHHESREFNLEGAVYLYDLDTKSHIRKITPSVSNDILRFGRITKIDDTHVLIGTDSTRVVYLYSIEDETFERTFIEKVNQKFANTNSSTYYGSDLELFGDYIIVAAYNHIHDIFNNGATSQGGSVYIYSKTDPAFIKELIAPEFTIEFSKVMFIHNNSLIIRGRERLTTNTSDFYLHTLSFEDGSAISISDASQYSVETYKNGVLISLPGTSLITESGSYRIVVTDTSGNSSEVEFTR
jgi:hypothetical protein